MRITDDIRVFKCDCREAEKRLSSVCAISTWQSFHAAITPRLKDATAKWFHQQRQPQVQVHLRPWTTRRRVTVSASSLLFKDTGSPVKTSTSPSNMFLSGRWADGNQHICCLKCAPFYIIIIIIIIYFISFQCMYMLQCMNLLKVCDL